MMVLRLAEGRYHRRPAPGPRPFRSARWAGRSSAAAPALMMPVLIVGGILSGSVHADRGRDSSPSRYGLFYAAFNRRLGRSASTAYVLEKKKNGPPPVPRRRAFSSSSGAPRSSRGSSRRAGLPEANRPVALDRPPPNGPPSSSPHRDHLPPHRDVHRGTISALILVRARCSPPSAARVFRVRPHPLPRG